jgi:hypothetical protein
MDIYEFTCHKVASANMTFPDKPPCTMKQYRGRLTDLSMQYTQEPDRM